MSKKLYIPKDYKSVLTLRETQHAIKYIKDVFQQALSFALTLDRVSAPLIVKKGSGINDDLNGVERKVDFDIKEINAEAEVVQSLAKWKRMALYRYGYNPGEGIYTDKRLQEGNGLEAGGFQSIREVRNAGVNMEGDPEGD